MYRGAIIGLGNIAIKGHLPAYLNPKIWRKDAAIVAGCDLMQENLLSFHQIIPEAKLYFNVKDMMQREKLDFVDICTPPNTHLDLINQACEKNLDIICEKPIAVNLETIFKIKKIISQKKVVFTPCHQYRYSPVWQKILELVNTKKIGDIFLLQFFVYRTEANKGNEYWHPKWRSEAKFSGGGIVMDHGSHLFYLASSLLGRPKYITAQMSRLMHFEYSVEDTAWINVGHENANAMFSLTWAAKEREMDILILGTKGEIKVRENEITLNASGRKDIIKLEKGMSADSSHFEWYIPLFKEFFRRMDKTDLGADGLDEVLRTTLCVSGAYKSAEINKTVALIADSV